MDTREWALVAYTILTQMAVGSFVVLGLVYWLSRRKSSVEQADRLSTYALLAIGPVLVLGIIASLFHLENPMNAFRALSNIGSSWLSREIGFTVAFAILGAVFAVMQWRRLSTPDIRNGLAAVTALFGLGLVYSMAQVYMLPNQPSWDMATTPLGFLTTTLLLGTLAIGAALSLTYAVLRSRQEADLQVQNQLLREALRWIAVGSIVLLGLQLVIVAAGLIDMAAGEASASVVKLAEDYDALFVLRLGLVFVGAGIFAFFLYKAAASAGQERVLALLVYGAFALVLVAEVLGRYLFYATHVKIGF